jgi:hypothetical protein
MCENHIAMATGVRHECHFEFNGRESRMQSIAMSGILWQFPGGQPDSAIPSA